MRTTTMKTTATTRRLLLAISAGLGILAATETAQAQEILLTGPLAGAPAVRKLRLYRQGRVEVTPSATFTLLDKYQRTILPGLQLDYNFTDWLSLGVWGAFSPEPLHLPLGLTKKVQNVNEDRGCRDPNTGDPAGQVATTTNCRLTAVNLGLNFEDQLGQITWVAAPQITGVPFRGKVSFFKKAFVDTELYFFLGAAFVGLQERVECGPASDTGIACSDGDAFERESRLAIGPTVGLGFTFWANKWSGLSLQYRLLPFGWNSGGFDTAGGDPDGEFPDSSITKDDRPYQFNQLLTVGWSFYFPFEHRISE
ncbi:MAG TPA: hypothetical protein PLU22_06155 [Polyangiaceae bacterium]|mgnify:CR=1 FL=1|nr:hypothetical protein [Polyangiaceae bacterium]